MNVLKAKKLGYKFFFKRKRLKSQYIFKQEDINKVFNNVDFVEVISDFVALKKSGRDFVGRCPFCKEITTNSTHFRVSGVKQLYKCFECGAGGTNCVSFLMRYYKAPFDKIILFIDRKYAKVGILPEKIRPIKNRFNIDDDLPF